MWSVTGATACVTPFSLLLLVGTTHHRVRPHPAPKLNGHRPGPLDTQCSNDGPLPCHTQGHSHSSHIQTTTTMQGMLSCLLPGRPRPPTKEELQARINGLEAKNRQQQEELTAQAARLGATERELASATGKLQAEAAASGALRQELQAARKEHASKCQAYDASIKKLKHLAASQQEQLQEARGAAASLEEARQRKAEEVAQLESRLQGLRDDMTQLQVGRLLL